MSTVQIKRKLMVGSAFYSIGNMGGAGLNMLYQFVIIVFLSTSDYGIVQPLLQFVGLFQLPVMAYQYALTKHLSALSPEHIEKEMPYIIRIILIVEIIVAIFWMGSIPLFKSIFHVSDTVIFILAGFSLLLNIPQTPYISRLQAEHRFVTAGLTQAIQGVTRITLGLVIVKFIPNVTGALLGVLISNVAYTLGNTIPYIKHWFERRDKTYKPHPFSLRSLFISLGSVGLFSFLTYSDTILVRSFLPDQSGLFASSNLLGKGMLFLCQGVSFAVLPLMANKLHDSTKALWVGLAFLIVLMLGYMGFFYFTAPFLGAILFAKDAVIQKGFQQLMPVYNMVFFPYPIVYYFLNYYLVKESRFYPILLGIGVTFLYAGLSIWHNSLTQVNIVIATIGYSLLVAVLIHALAIKKVYKKEKVNS
ncbi:MAG: oligosaccharide flippase family protein [Brevinema sp.]